MKNRDADSVNALAEKVLNKVQEAIMKKYCIMTPVIMSMKLRPVSKECVLETDGQTIYYQPDQICRMAGEKRMGELQKWYMHLILHGILFHYVDYRKYSVLTLANAVFDLEVDLFLSKLEGLPGLCLEGNDNYHNRDFDIEMLLEEGADILYEAALESKELRRAIYCRAKAAFRDHHENWEKTPGRMIQQDLLRNGAPGGGADGGGGRTKEEKEQIRRFWTSMMQDCMLQTGLSLNELVGRLKGEKGTYGDVSMGMGDVVEKDDSQPLDYVSVLRNFFREREVCRMDPENFDRDYYALGLDLYDDIALLEPREEGEKISAGTIVLAIDTSGSCAGDIIKKFLTETEGLLHTMTQVDYRELVVFQADAEICSEVHLKPHDPIPDYSCTTIYGFGGTDFEPVFTRVEELNEESPVDVLIYLTDGDGIFPAEESPVKTFFVIPGSEEEVRGCAEFIPDWIECLAIE